MRGLLILFAAGTAAADPQPKAFVELEAGAGVATVSAGGGLCGSYAAPDGLLALAHGGGGAGVFVSRTLALVGRAHATIASAGGTSGLSLFVGAGIQLRLAPREAPAEYWFLEIVPGYEAVGMSEVGNSDALGIALRAGVNLSYVTLALGSTVLVNPSSPRAYSQTDLTFIVGFHGGWLSD